jgi:hypothetical protein
VTRALARGIRVVPLLIDETEMPSLEELPEDLKSLRFRQAFRVDSGVDFHHHLDRLCAAIEAASPGGETDSAPPLPPRPAPAAGQRDESKDAGARPHQSAASAGRPAEKVRTSGLARAALICSLAGPLLVFFQGLGLHAYFQVFICCLFAVSGAAVLFGHVARKQIRRNPSLSGDLLALIGLILGYIMLLLAVIGTIAVIHDRAL